MFNLEEIFIEICTSNFLSSYHFFNFNQLCNFQHLAKRKYRNYYSCQTVNLMRQLVIDERHLFEISISHTYHRYLNRLLDKIFDYAFCN